MHLIVIYANLTNTKNTPLLQFAASSEPLAGTIFDELTRRYSFGGSNSTIIAVPAAWQAESQRHHPNIMYYNGSPQLHLRTAGKGRWFILSNGRFVTTINYRWFMKTLDDFDDDILAVNADSTLLPYREKIRITSSGNIAGFRRLHSDLVLPAPLPHDWPHHLFIKPHATNKILVNNALLPAFADFVDRCSSCSLKWRSFKISGTVVDLETHSGLLDFLKTALNLTHRHPHNYNHRNRPGTCLISSDARIFGNVIIGQNVHISKNAVVVGPTILCDNVKIGQGAVIKISIIGPGVAIPADHLVQNCVVTETISQHISSLLRNNIAPPLCHISAKPAVAIQTGKNNFRIWPKLSYARCIKRIIDITISSAVLVLFAPVFLIIAVAIKLGSPGPVFFRDKRQGQHGKEFYCLKFRTMIKGAEKIQEKLRFRNQVDGPQFKLDDDPRVTAAGKFLRDTFLDEIPQFINILLGQMSIIGPRPSPKTENSLCPFWRDARLSVRPGITGLWQICRTRQPGCDFQEWIYYDTKYVRNLSLRLDLFICWCTAGKLIKNFIRRF